MPGITNPCIYKFLLARETQNPLLCFIRVKKIYFRWFGYDFGHSIYYLCVINIHTHIHVTHTVWSKSFKYVLGNAVNITSK